MPSTVKVDALADFKVSARRAPIYNVADKAARVAVPAISDAAQVTRGAHAKNGTPVLLVQDGSAQHALPLSAIGAAIAGGVITRAEIDALLA
jgi:hypothetical protein